MANPTDSEKNQISLNEAFQKGIEHYQHQRIDEAKHIFLQILDYVPDSVDVLQVLAVIENEGGSGKEPSNIWTMHCATLPTIYRFYSTRPLSFLSKDLCMMLLT